MLGIISFIFVFSLIVFFHELGHFLMGKLNDVHVKRFALGMGPKIVGYQGGETEYSIRAFPIGGFCDFEGESEPSEDPRSLMSKGPWQRFAIFFAGPFMNFVLAIVLLTIVMFTLGAPTNAVGFMDENMPAYQAGLMENDTIISIDGVETPTWNDVVENINSSGGSTQSFEIVRDGQEVFVKITPAFQEEQGRYMIGIGPAYKKSLTFSIKAGFQETVNMTTSIFKFLGSLFKGETTEGSVVGPVGMVGIVSDAADMGFLNLLYIAAYISINLGIVNLLPFPALDGGRIVFVIIELIKGSPLNTEKENSFHVAGFLILMGLMVFMLFRDFMNLGFF